MTGGPSRNADRRNLERRFTDWAGREAAQAVRWTVLKPTEATANLPLLSVQDDGSIFASGDQSKSDLYTLRFSTDLQRITAIRLEALPDDRLPRRGPGRVFYEGPFGDFFLSEFSVKAGDKAMPLKQADSDRPGQGGGRGRASTATRRPAGRSAAARASAHSAVFHARRTARRCRAIWTSSCSSSATTRPAWAASGSRSTTDPRPIAARDIPAEIEEILLIPEEQRTAEQNARCASTS